MIIHVEFEIPDPIEDLWNQVTQSVLAGQTFEDLNGDLVEMVIAEEDRVWRETLENHGDFPRQGTIQFGPGPYRKDYILGEY